MKTIKSLNNLNPRTFIHELIVTNKCANNSIIISLDIYDKQDWIGFKYLFEK